MPQKQLRISIQMLPSRARGLSASETSQVFGGCKHKGEACGADSDCCDRMQCLGGYASPTCTDEQGPRGGV